MAVIWLIHVKLDEVLVPAVVVTAVIGAVLVIRFVARREFYTALLFASHETMFVFTLYAYLRADTVLRVLEFDYSVFIEENLRTAMIALLVTLGTIAAVCLCLGKASSGGGLRPFSDLFAVVLGRMASLREAQIHGLVAVSFFSAAALFVCGTSVMEVPYPSNNAHLRYPPDLLKLPTVFALLGLASVHAKMLWAQTKPQTPLPVLYLTRTNVVVSSLLSLTILGSRGYFVFMLGVAAFLEFYSARKKSIIPFFGMVFILLSYFLYTGWPYLRGNLAQGETVTALRTSVEIALGFGDTASASAAEDMVDLGSFPLIGQSLFHLLYVIQLENQGTSLAGSTFLNLIPQALPGFLDGVLWDRPLNDNWKLAELYVHGGGFLAIANAYWNGGMVVMALFVVCLTFVVRYLDAHMSDPEAGIIFRVLYLAVFPVVGVQIFYGIQGLAKPLELLLLVIVWDKVTQRKKCRLQGRHATVSTVE